MQTVTHPTQSLIRFELTVEQTQLVLIALYALDEGLHDSGKPIRENVEAGQLCFGIDICPDTDSDESIGVTVDNIFNPYFTATHLDHDELRPLNDDEFGDSAEIVSIRPGESLEVEPS